MTKEQAIKEMQDWTGNFCEADGDWEFRPCIECARDCVTKDALKIAIECIRKQISMNPPQHDSSVCPNCNSKWNYEIPYTDYCCHCGQKIDWSE